MNIFYVSSDPKTCAQYHCDKHVVKMILEYSQLLSTAHRILDGVERKYFSEKKGKLMKKHFLSEDIDNVLYLSFSPKHPSAIWTRASDKNYRWLNQLLKELHAEFEHRYGKEHSSKFLLPYFDVLPKNIPIGPITQPTQSMPDYCKGLDSIQAYRNYYTNEKVRFATWKKRAIPNWYAEKVPYDSMPLIQKLHDGLITEEEYDAILEENKE